MSRKNTRLHGLDTLRAAAIVLVFMYHYMVFVSGEPTFGWGSTVGWAGVDLFFVLSGYLIADQLFAGLAARRELSLRAFYARRLLRTLPDYYVVLALYFLFPAAMGGKTPPPLWQFLSFTQNILLHPGTAFSHAWSLCIEEQFYLLLPLALVIGARWRGSVRHAWLALIGLMLAAIALRSMLWLQYAAADERSSDWYYRYIYYASWCRCDEFLPGVALALIKHFHAPLWMRVLGWGNRLLAAGALAVALMFYLGATRYYVDGAGYPYFMTGFGYTLLAASFALLLLAALAPGSLLQRVRVPGAAPLAAWSYAIYLSHKPLAHVLHQPLHQLGIAGFNEVLVIAAACVLAGWLLHRCVETPFMRWRARRWPDNFPAAAPAAAPALQPGM
ncbi:MAG TPA: acyltransferase [Nevskiaceae bacterium]|nr:acyltransferase [Nevskiaceae bacterium]